MESTEKTLNQTTPPLMQGESLGVPPVDSDHAASKDPRDMGDNGNPAQSALRPTAEERNSSPAPLNEASRVTAEV